MTTRHWPIYAIAGLIGILTILGALLLADGIPNTLPLPR